MKYIVYIFAIFVAFLVIGNLLRSCNSDKTGKRTQETTERQDKLRREEIEKVRTESDNKVKEFREYSDKRLDEIFLGVF